MKMNIRLLLIIILALIVLGGVFWISRTFFHDDSARIDTSRAAVVKKVQSLGNLEATSFTIEKVITAGTEDSNIIKDFFFRDNLLLIAHGSVIAGFDLSLLTPEDVIVRGEEVTINIGEAKIISTSLDNSQTKVFDRDTGFLTKGDKNLEAEARAAAESSIRDAACQAGILEEAEKKGKEIVEKIFTFAGFEKVIVETKRGSC